MVYTAVKDEHKRVRSPAKNNMYLLWTLDGALLKVISLTSVQSRWLSEVELTVYYEYFK